MPPLIPQHLILTARTPGGAAGRRSLARDASRGTLVRIKRGAYLPSTIWNELDVATRHIARIHAFAHSHPHSVFSHQSAALLLGLPLLGPVPDRVHVTSDRASGGRSEPGLTRHCVGIRDSEIVELDSCGAILATSAERTVVDLAASQPFSHAIAPLDHALRERIVSHDGLRAHLADRGSQRGTARASAVVEFGDARSMSAGESLSRAVIHELGFLRPELQMRHLASGGGQFFTDFEWPDHRMIGEFDGKSKYLKQEYLAGRSSGEAVYEEKLREDFLRGEGNRLARWGWNDAWNRAPLAAKLHDLGVPRVRHPAIGR